MIDFELNTASKKEHVTEIERFNYVVKERVRSDKSPMLIQRVSKMIIIHPVVTAISWINDFPTS